MSDVSLRRKLASDPHRPQYHFLPPSNWMNDPNGVIQWKGRYHLFYQHNPTGPLWGNMHWGHASSPDLIHWTDEPLALAPTPGGPDESGCFSGCAFDDNGVPTLLYTATAGQHHEIQTQCLATSSDDNLRAWNKYAYNPVISEVPSAANQSRDFRDPFVWKEGDTWYTVIASRVQDVGGVVFLYRSKDLREWEYLHPLIASSDSSIGIIWECPNFFRLGERWVLIISAHTGNTPDRVYYYVGDYHEQRFAPVAFGTLDYGCVYAPLSFEDDQGRRMLFGWLREERSNAAIQQAGWAGVQWIPRILELDEHNRLLTKPAPELEGIRGARYGIGTRVLDQPVTLNMGTTALDIAVEFEPRTSAVCGLALVYAALPEESIHIDFNVNSQQIVIRKQAESPDAAGKVLLEAPHQLAPDEALKLRVLLDGSVVEVIANDRTSLSARFYPTATNSVEIRAFGEGARLRSLDAWEMPSVYTVSAAESLTGAERVSTPKG